jgi:predicted  nucleic acid-binding Zn-ribbon protein
MGAVCSMLPQSAPRCAIAFSQLQSEAMLVVLSVRASLGAARTVCIACSDNSDKLMALTRELFALKLVESQLQASVAAANGNADAAQARMQQLEAEIARIKRGRPSAAATSAASDDSHAVAELHAAAAAKESELYAVRSELVEARQQCEAKDRQLQQAHEASESLATDLQREKGAAEKQLRAQLEQLDAEAEVERHALSDQVHQARDKVAELQRRLHEEV